MDLGFAFETMCGVVRCPLRKLSQFCMTARGKDAHVADHLVVVSGSYQWDVSFFRAAHD
jgi:hypothetical protein